MTSRLSRRTVFVLILACVLATACQDRQRPKPVTAEAIGSPFDTHC
jgi:hypothetical protein